MNHTKGNVQFYCGGGAAIGNSFSLLKFHDYYFGMDWGGGFEKNSKPIYDWKKPIDTLLISHAHHDHIGQVPILADMPVKRILATEETKELSRLSWNGAILRAKKIGDKAPFTENDVEKVINKIEIIKVDSEISLSEGLTMIPVNSGHILGSISPMIIYKGEVFFMTSDICFRDRSLLKGAIIPTIQKTKLLVRESTYINTDFEKRQFTVERFVRKVKEILAKGGRILIPALSVDRMQDMFIILQEAGISNLYMDGAYMVTEIYAKYLKSNELSSVKRFKSLQEKNDFLNSNKPGVIIATSGMVDEDTFSFDWAEKLMPNSRDAIIFVSYQDPESQGSKIQNTNKGKFIVFNGKITIRSCEVDEFNFSAHMSGSDGTNLEGILNPETIIYNHGSKKEIVRYITTRKDKIRRVMAEVGKWVSV